MYAKNLLLNIVRQYSSEKRNKSKRDAIVKAGGNLNFINIYYFLKEKISKRKLCL